MTIQGDRDIYLVLRTIMRVLIYLAVLISGVIFYFGKDIVMPIVLGLIISLTLAPVVRTLYRFRIPSPLGALLVVASLSSVFGLGVSALSTPVGDMFESLPNISQKLKMHIRQFQPTLDEISRAGEQVDELTSGNSNEEINEVVIEGPGLISSAASTVATGFTSVFIALLLSVFMLGSGNLFYEKLVAAVPTLADKKRAIRIIKAVEHSVSHYLLTITIINVCLGTVIAGLLFLIDAPNPLLWGIIAAAFNFLPFLGAIAGALLLAAISIGTYDSLSAAIIPPVIYYACSAIEGNLITPLIIGRRLQLNIVAVFLSVAIWGWLWGLAGALMAVPILVFVSVLCEHIKSLQGLGHFLTGRNPPSPTDKEEPSAAPPR